MSNPKNDFPPNIGSVKHRILCLLSVGSGNVGRIRVFFQGLDPDPVPIFTQRSDPDKIIAGSSVNYYFRFCVPYITANTAFPMQIYAFTVLCRINSIDLR